MPSLRARLLTFYLKHQMKAKPLHQMSTDALTKGAERLAPNRLPSGVALELVHEGGVNGEWLRTHDNPAGVTILYFHGGGYSYCSPKSHRGLTSGLAQVARANVFSQDYRLAPAYRFPAAVDDAVAGYRWLLDGGVDPEKTIVSGDSAGGGLALALMLSCVDVGLPLPAGAILYSPWTDLTVSGASFASNVKSDAMFKATYLEEAAKTYLGDADPMSPLASPLYGSLGGLPPVLTFVSDSEMLRDDATRLHEKLRQAGVASTLIVEKGLAHVWPIFHPRIPEAAKSIAQSAAFIRERIKT